MRCPQCGKEIGDVTAAQCPSCGLRFTDGELPGDHRPGAEAEPGRAPLTSAPPASAEYPQHEVPPSEAASAPASYVPYPPGNVPSPPAPSVAPAQPLAKGRMALLVTLTVIGVLLIGGGSAAAYFTAAQTGKPAISAPTATVGATATPTPMATQTSYVIYQNALTKKTAGWANDTHCRFENDGYHVLDNYVCFAPTYPLADVDVSVDVQQVSGASNNAYGISFRYPTPTSGGYANHYVFGIASYGYWVVWKESNGHAITLADFAPNSAIHRGQTITPGQTITNRLRVRTNGQQFDFFINGTYVGHVDDSRFANGYVGSQGYVGVTGCAGCDVVFTNISVSQV